MAVKLLIENLEQIFSYLGYRKDDEITAGKEDALLENVLRSVELFMKLELYGSGSG